MEEAEHEAMQQYQLPKHTELQGCQNAETNMQIPIFTTLPFPLYSTTLGRFKDIFCTVFSFGRILEMSTRASYEAVDVQLQDSDT